MTNWIEARSFNIKACSNYGLDFLYNNLFAFKF